VVEKWTIGPEINGTVDVLVFSEDEDTFWEAMSAFADTHAEGTWEQIEEGHVGEHSMYVTFQRGENSE
jgi:hypothetical protein